MIDATYWDGFSQVLSIAELSRIYRKSEQTLWRWLNDGLVPGHRIGVTWVVYRESVQRSIETDTQNGGLPVDFIAEFPEEMSIDHVATFYGRPRQVTYNWLGAGLLPGHRLGRSWLLYKSEQIARLQETSNQLPKPTHLGN